MIINHTNSKRSVSFIITLIILSKLPPYVCVVSQYILCFTLHSLHCLHCGKKMNRNKKEIFDGLYRYFIFKFLTIQKLCLVVLIILTV